MNNVFLTAGSWPAAAIFFLFVLTAGPAVAQDAGTGDPVFYGPYNGVFLPDGDGLKKTLAKDDSLLRADSS